MSTPQSATQSTTAATSGRLPAPRALPAAGWLGPLAALVLVAVGVVLGQAALARWGVFSTSWLGSAVDGLDGTRAGSWTVPAGALLVLLGLLLLVATLKPRRRTHVRVDGDADLWMSPQALGALARDAAEGVPGVARVTVSATATAVKLRAAAEDPDRVSAAVEEAVQGRLDGADVRVSVRTTRYRPEGQDL